MWPFSRKRNAQGWMLTFSGAIYYPSSPRVEDIRIVGIAHHLSMLCRYTGACRKFYSVAEHSVLVSQVVPPEHAFAALMHDATEAYVNDIARPLKRHWLMWGYRRLEHRTWCMIARKFGLPEQLPHSVHQADRAVLCAEQAALVCPLPQSQGFRIEPADVLVQGLPPAAAEKLFLDRFFELTLGRGYISLDGALCLEGCCAT